MSHHLPQESSHPTERGSHSHNHRGIMDLRNLCQRLDVDSLKAKLPSLPQLKLPKSLPKLRGARRIFRSSRENVNPGKSGAGQGSAGVGVGGVDTLAVPHAQSFINRTPQRISTISSLMYEQTTTTTTTTGQQMSNDDHHHLDHDHQNHPGSLSATYCSAGSLDDDYYAPYGGGGNTAARASRPISPVKMPPAVSGTEAPQRATLTQRLQRGYKSLSELRLKHLFAKQTTIRRDNIEVQHYVAQYEADRRVEQKAQARRDREIADNYHIHISTLPITRENTLKQRGDHHDHDDDEEEEGIVEQVQRRKHAEPSGDESGLETPPAVAASASGTRKKTGIAATRFSKVRQPPLQMPVEDLVQSEPQQQPEKQREVMRQAVRQNLKRLRKSIKRVHQARQQNADDTDDEAEKEKDPTKLRTSTLRARLRRFTSSEQLQQRWRKSFKTSESQHPREDKKGDESDAGGVGVGTGVAAGVGAHLERTMAKLNEKMQNLKFFQRSNEKSTQQLGNKPNTVGREPIEIDDEELAATYHHSDSSSDDSGENPFDQEEDHQQQQQQSPMLCKHQTMAKLAQIQANSSTAWSSESLEEDGTMDQQLASSASDYPRVLIHQQHTDAYESTLIIAVTTTPPSPSPSPSPAGPSRPAGPAVPAAPLQSSSPLQQWVPNDKIIAGFKEQQQMSGAWPAPSLYKPKSIDIFESDGGAAAAFADFDEALRNAPVLRISAGSSCDSTEDAEDDSSSRVTRIRVQTPRIGNSCESLMEQQPLDDDDEEEEQQEQESEEDEGVEKDEEMDQPESERPPSVSPPPPPLPQRRPPPPAVMAPIYDAVPPPLPISKPPTIVAPAAPVTTLRSPAIAATTPATAVTVPPTTPKSPVTMLKSPVTAPVAPLARLPQRSASMTRPGKPLVKTSSLRLTYNEQMHPGDVGKVNKLISRFEGRPRLCARRLHSEELTICSDEESESEELPPTPTPANVNRNKKDNDNNNIPDIVTTQPVHNNNNDNPSETTIQLSLDRQNSNCSRSEYGSPLSYPLSTSRQRRSSTPTMLMTTTGSGRAGLAPQSQQQSQSQPQQSQLLQQRAQARRSRRSMTRDDDNFYSFDSDEENSYYSISPSSSSRYVVEI